MILRCVKTQTGIGWEAFGTWGFGWWARGDDAGLPKGPGPPGTQHLGQLVLDHGDQLL